MSKSKKRNPYQPTIPSQPSLCVVVTTSKITSYLVSSSNPKQILGKKLTLESSLNTGTCETVVSGCSIVVGKCALVVVVEDTVWIRGYGRVVEL